MLSTGLLICAPAGIACADNDNGKGNSSHNASSSSAGNDDSSGSQSNGPGAGPPSKSLHKAVRDAIDSVTSAGGAHSSTSGRPAPTKVPRTKVSTSSSASSSPGAGQAGSGADTGGGSATPDTTGDAAASGNSSSSAADPDPAGSTPDTATTVPAASVDPVPTTAPVSETAVAPTAPLSGSPAPAAIIHGVKPLPAGGAAAPLGTPTNLPAIPNLLAPTASALVASLTQIATSLGTAAFTVPGLLWSLPTSPTPIADVIEFIQNTLTAVTGAVAPLIQLPGDLASMLLGTNWATPVSTLAQPNVGSFIPPSAVVPSLLPVQLPTAPSIFVPPQFVPASGAAELATRGGIATAPILNAPATILKDAEPAEAVSSDGAAFIKGAVTALLVSVSLWALFTAALPGLSGLAAISATGVRIGYRQANAGAALRATGLARFAAGGPIGVVRSGSMVAVHVRPQHAANAAAPAKPVQLRIVADNAA